MSIIATVVIRDDLDDNHAEVMSFDMPELCLNDSLPDEENLERLGIDPNKHIFMSHIYWDGIVKVPTHENNAMYREPNVVKTLITLSKLQKVIDETSEDIVNAEFEVGWTIEEVISNTVFMKLITAVNETELGYKYAETHDRFNEIPVSLRKYIDYGKYGKTLVNEYGFTKTSYGYLY